MRRAVLLGIVIILSAGLIAGGVAYGVKHLRIATAGTTGALYPMGVLMAKTINKYLPEFKASAQATAGSVANLRMLYNGEVEWGISQQDIAWFAYHGMPPFKGRKMDNLRSLFGTLSGWLQIFAPANSPIKSIKDLKGKKVSVGAPGSGGEIDARMLLSYYGITYKDIKPFFLPEKEAVAALKSGTIDAMIATHPLRSAAFLDLTNTYHVKMIPVDDPGVYEKFPFFERGVIPKGTYKGVDYDVVTPKIKVIMLTTTKSGLSDDEIYKLLKVIFEHRDEWKDAHAAVRKYVTLENAAKGVAIPFHAGAIKFYKEKGFKIPKKLYPPEYK